MKGSEDILARAIDELKNEQIPQGPPTDLVDATLAGLDRGVSQQQDPGAERVRFTTVLAAAKSCLSSRPAKVAAAAVLLICSGYVIGRLSAPRPADTKRLYVALESSLRSSLEPAIRQALLEEMSRRWQPALLQSCSQLREELSQQFRQDFNRLAVQTLVASNAVTNQLLRELVQSIDYAQTQDLRRVAAALCQLELNRVQDKTQLSNELKSLAYYTGDQLDRTRQGVARLLINTWPGAQKTNVPAAPDQSDDGKD